MKIIFKPLFQKYLIYCFKSTFVVGLTIFIEALVIIFSLLYSLLMLYSENVTENISNFFKSLIKFSPIYFVKNYLNCEVHGVTNITVCNANNFLILLEILITVFIMGFLLFFILQEILLDFRSEDNTAEKLTEKQTMTSAGYTNSLTFFFVNFLDFIIHFCSIGIFYMNFNEIFAFLNLLNAANMSSGIDATSSTNSNVTISLSAIILVIVSILILCLYFFIYIAFIKNINLIIQYNKELSTHYDHLFSVKYDYTLFFVKIFISLDNAFETNNIITERSREFVKLFIIFIILGFNIYLIYSSLIVKKILYLSNHKFNIFRIFMSFFGFFSYLFILVFHNIFYQNFYVVYLCFFIAFIVAIFFSIVLNSLNYVAIYSTDNYILQTIYILNIKYNATEKEVNSEVSNVMFHHKNYCIHHRTCPICKMENFEFDNFLFNFSHRTKQILNSKSSNFTNFEKSDIPTFDIIKLLIIENLDKNKIIKLIYKARRILEKYEVKKRYDNNYFNILIYNNYMKRLITKNQILKFKIIQCYEDTSHHINEALSIIDTMLMSLNNGEKHLFTKSSDLFFLKDKISKNVLFLSYYQNYFVDTYSIIIYRFIFKNLFNCEINDYVTIYNFEEIKDLINYMFNNEKLIQIKLNFNNNSMKLLRLGKDLIDYRNKSFEDMIPGDFKEHCTVELIKKIKSSYNEENKSFEYVMTDSENSLKSIRLNFTILASFKLDEVILIGQYDIIKDDLILIKKNYTNINFDTYSNLEFENDNLDHSKSLPKRKDSNKSNLSNQFSNNQKRSKIKHSQKKDSTSYNSKQRNKKINTAKNINHNDSSSFPNKSQNNHKENSFTSYSHEKDNNQSLFFDESKEDKDRSRRIDNDNNKDNKIDRNKYKDYSQMNKKSDNDSRKNSLKKVGSSKIIDHKKSLNNKSTKFKTKNKQGFNSDISESTNININESIISEKLIGSKFKNFSKIFERNNTLNNKGSDGKNLFGSSSVSNDTEIVNFSSNLQNALFIKTSWLNKIKLKYNIPFADIFETIKILDNKKIYSNKFDKKMNINICKINYDKYYLIYQRLISYVEEEMNNDEIKENLSKFRHISKSNKISFYKFEFLYEIIIAQKENLYLLFKIKQIQNDDNVMEIINADTLTHIEKGLIPEFETKNIFKKEEYEMEKLNSIIKEKETNSVSSNTISSNTKSDAFMAADSSRKTIANNDQRMNKFTIFSLIFCIFLVFYCLFFLAIGMINNNNIRKLYLIRNNFNDFRYFFYHTSMNFFFNLAINKNDLSYLGNHETSTSIVSGVNNNMTDYSNGTKIFNNQTMTTNKNIESLFFEKFKDNKAITLSISKFVVQELAVKLNILRDIYVNLQNAIYSSHYKDSLDGIFNHKTKFYQINKVGDKLSVSYLEKYFFETVNIFFNHGKVIVDNISNTNYIYLSIINAKNDKVDFGNIDLSGIILTEVQIKMYEIILNYLHYYKNFIEIGDMMNTFFSDSLTDVFNSTYLLSFILMGIHLFLFFGGVFIVKFLHKIISQNDKMLCASNDEENIKFMREKLKSIKNLSLLFVENPRSLVLSINAKRAEYMKKLCASIEIKNKRKLYKDKYNRDYEAEFGSNGPNNSTLVSLNVADPTQTENHRALGNENIKEISHGSKTGVSYLDKLAILIPFMQLILVLFLLYYIYNMIFYVVFRSSYSDFMLTSDFANQNTDLDNKMMNNINLLCTMMILNKTELDVSYDLSGEKNKIMMELLTNILNIRTSITKYKKINSKFQSIEEFENVLMNCTYIYSNLNDTIFYDLQQINIGGNLIESLTAICYSYSFMKTNRIDSIFDEISYNSLHLYNLYDTSNKTYNEISNIYENYMFYDVFIIFMFIFRPIRKFSSDYVYNNIIASSSNNYLVLTIVYLILNILVDLFIFYIINRMVVKKISDINKHLNNMITCVSFRFSNNNKKEKGE